MENMTVIKYKNYLRKKEAKLMKKLQSPFICAKKKDKIREEINAMSFALETIETMSSLEKFFGVKEVTKEYKYHKIKETKITYEMETTFCDLKDIPSLECAMLKSWKSKYGNILNNVSLSEVMYNEI